MNDSYIIKKQYIIMYLYGRLYAIVKKLIFFVTSIVAISSEKSDKNLNSCLQFRFTTVLFEYYFNTYNFER